MLKNGKGGVHWRIAEAAKEFAGEFYEARASFDNAFYKAWPNQRNFIRKNWKSFVGPARQVLTSMLNTPGRPEDQKEQIYEALLMDRVINPKGGFNPKRIIH